MDQMIEFARSVGLEVSYASLGLFEHLLLTVNFTARCGGGGKACVRSLISNRAVTNVGESMASRLA